METKKKNSKKDPQEARETEPDARPALSPELSLEARELAIHAIERGDDLIACCNCGGLNLIIPPTSVDVTLVWLKDTAKYYCMDCGYCGPPILFADLESYEVFFRSKRTNYNLGEEQLDASYILPDSFSGASRPKKPWVAALLVILYPGLGQAYNGERRKGVIIAGIYSFFLGLGFLNIFFLAGGLESYETANMLFSLIVLIWVVLITYAMGDAYLTARKKGCACNPGKTQGKTQDITNDILND